MPAGSKVEAKKNREKYARSRESLDREPIKGARGA